MMVLQLVVTILLILGGIFAYRLWVASPMLPGELEDEGPKAVFLTNGQVYFGELDEANKDFLKITNPYYLQNRTVLQEPVEEGAEPTQKKQLSLTALGGAGLQIHGPERSMFVPWNTVLYIEDLKDDSEVVKLIASDTSVNGSESTNTNEEAANTNSEQ